MVRLVIGRSGSGKSREIMERIKRGVGSRKKGQILLVPEQYSHDTERSLCSVCGDSLSLFAEVLTFRRLSSRILSEAGGFADTPLDNSGRIILIKSLLDELNDSLTVFRGASAHSGMLKRFMNLIDELKSYRVTADAIVDIADGLSATDPLSSKLRDIALVFEGYNAYLHRMSENGVDSSDIFTMVYEQLKYHAFFAGREVYIDGFSGFDPQEFAIIGEMLKSAENLTIALTCDRIDEGKEAGFGLFSPVRKTARAIIRLCEREGIPFDTETLGGDCRHTAAGLRAIEAHLYDYNAKETFDNDGVELYSASDIYSECAYAAARIAGLIKQNGWRCRDFAVIVRKLGDYETQIETAFRRAGLPVFLDRTTDILRKPAALHILSALDTVYSNFSYEHLFSYLRCGLSGISDEECDLLENYSYTWGLKGADFAPENILTLSPVDRGRTDDALLSRINEIKNRATGPLFRLKQALPARGDLSEYTEALIGFLKETGFEEHIALRMEALETAGETRIAAEYSQLMEAILAVIDQCSVAGVVREVVLRQFRELFSLALSERRIGTIPTSLDGVRVGEADRLHGTGVKCALVLGVAEGVWPLANTSEGVISDSERELLLENDLTLAPTNAQRAFEEQFVIYNALMIPSERLIITAPERAADGSRLSKSFLFGRIELLTGAKTETEAGTGRLFYAYSPESCFEYAMTGPKESASFTEALAAAGYGEALRAASVDPAEGRRGIGSDLAGSLYGSSPLVSATAAETLAACRFAYFARRGLGAKPRRQNRFEAPQVGDFVHAVLENTLREVEKRGGWRKVELADVLAVGRREAARYEIEWFRGRRRTGRTAYLFKRLNAFINNMLENMYNELVSSEFSPMFFELDFSPNGDMPAVEVETGGDRSLRLQGRVDRVDGFEKDGELYIRVIDYKTGGKPFDFTEILNGMGMQMLIYLFAIERNGISGRKVVPAGVLYIPGMGVNTVDLPRDATDESIMRKKEEAMRRFGLVLDDMDVIRAMEPDVSRRFIPVKATNNGFDRNSYVASPQQMKQLAAHVEKTLKKLGCELQNGFTQANPYRRGPLKTACDYCEFKPVCLFDESNGSDRFRSLSSVKKDEFWQMIGREENPV